MPHPLHSCIVAPTTAIVPLDQKVVARVPVAPADCKIANRDPVVTFPIAAYIPAAIDPPTIPAPPKPINMSEAADTATTALNFATTYPASCKEAFKF